MDEVALDLVAIRHEAEEGVDADSVERYGDASWAAGLVVSGVLSSDDADRHLEELRADQESGGSNCPACREHAYRSTALYPPAYECEACGFAHAEPATIVIR